MTEFSPYKYAYWVKDNGDLLEVRRSHAVSILDYLKEHPENDFDGDKTQNYDLVIYGLKRLHWIRIHLGSASSYPQEILLEAGTNSVTPQAYKAIKAILEEYPYQNIFLDITRTSDDVESKRYRDISKALGKLKENTVNKIEAVSVKPTVLKNPPIQKLLKFLDNAQYRELKGLIVDQDVYWWNQTEDWHHGQQAIKLGLGKAMPADREFKPYIDIPNFDKMRLTLMYETNQNGDEVRVLVNSASLSSRYVTDIPYLRRLVIEGDLWLDGHDPKNKFNYVNGRDYIKGGGVMAKASQVRIQVHASVRANDARARLDLYKRLKNEKKI